MEINQNKVVAITYTLIVDGKEADKATAENPLKFIFGTGMLLPKFEENLENKKAEDTFEFTLTPEEGYGLPMPEMIVELPKNIFEVDGKVQEEILFVGNIIPMMNNMGGIMQGKVAEVREDVVVMDFNHPMAGKTLNFSGKVIEVREATEQELTDGLFGEKKAHQGGCSGSCSDDCCSSCGGGCH